MGVPATTTPSSVGTYFRPLPSRSQGREGGIATNVPVAGSIAVWKRPVSLPGSEAEKNDLYPDPDPLQEMIFKSRDIFSSEEK